MNDAFRGAGATGAADLADVRLGDLPFVFLSYDEPWAETTWADLKRKVPGAVRVHGVKGLDACHKAAAAAVHGDWVVTVDADTVIGPAVPGIRVPSHLLRDHYRLDWLSRNTVNGLWTGNGCVKLWSRRLLREMRTHEAAPDGSLSLDHEIGNVVPGISGQLTRPERGSETDPARTAKHGFRAGFREAVFLHRMAADEAARRGIADWREAGPARPLGVWCSVGRHARNGHWVLYGARLGLLWPHLHPHWDPRSVNDYDWLDSLWQRRIAPRFASGPAGRGGWRWDWIEEDLRSLSRQLADATGFAVAEFDAEASQVVAENADLSATAAASRHDALGYRLMISSADSATQAAARGYLEVARCLDHPSAYVNIATVERRRAGDGGPMEEAVWNLRAAIALGSPVAEGLLREIAGTGIATGEAPARPAQRADAYPVLACDQGDLDASLAEIGTGFCFLLDAGIRRGPGMARHVPDPALCFEGAPLGYSSRCALTGRILPFGLRFGPAASFAVDPQRLPCATLPVVLGSRAAPRNAGEAVAFGLRDIAAGVVRPAFAMLGCDAAAGGGYARTVLAALLRADPAICGETPLEVLADRLSLQADSAVPHWTTAQTEWLCALTPPVASRDAWYGSAELLEAIGPRGGATARSLRLAADAIWGRAC